MPYERIIETDVLVIGAGMAGMFAAIKAREHGLDVTLTDKAHVGKAGSTHFSEGDMVYYRPERGHKIKDWLDVLSVRCEYINNRDWDEICLEESRQSYEQLISWGVPFYQKDGETYIFSFGTSRRNMGKYEDVTMQARKFAPTLRQKALNSGVRILDRITFGDLIKQDEQVVGAVGFNTISGDLYIVKAKATIIATGSSSLKSGTYPVHSWTGDGEAMAYRAGAEIVSKEFMYGMPRTRADIDEQLSEMRKRKREDTEMDIEELSYRYPHAIGGGFSGWYNLPTSTSYGTPVITPTWEAHCGNAPLYIDFSRYKQSQKEWLQEYLKRIGTHQADKIGLDVLKGKKIKWPAARIMTNSIFAGSGIWPVDKDCFSGIPGLYAAGNSCGTMASGALYAGMGFASNHAAVTGARAAKAAVEYAKKLGNSSIDQESITRTKEYVCQPMERKGGFSPSWLTQVLQGYLVPYFALEVKHEDRLKPILSLITFMKEHMAPKVLATNSHEWRMAIEIRNMIQVSEMRLRSSLFRTESRGNHFREDYPRRNDPEWLAWVKIKSSEMGMKLTKEPIPKEWWPDLSKSYEERYPNILPLEN